MLPTLAATAATQHGVFTRAQALAAGYREEQIRHRLRGAWTTLYAGVYVETAAYDVVGELWRPAGRATAALLALPAGAAVSHHSAARLWQLPLLADSAATTITLPPGSSFSERDGIHVHRATFGADDLGLVHGVRATCLARTVVDLGRSVSFRAAVVVADAALHSARIDQKSLRAAAARQVRWPGIRAARRVMEFADPLSESVLESVARVLWRDAGLPAPRTQFRIELAGRIVARVDFAWPAYRLVVEVDGLEKYADPGAIVAEKSRQNDLIEAGWIVLRFTWADIVHRPEQTAARIRRAMVVAHSVADRSA